MHPIFKIIMVLLNSSFVQYCDRSIGLLSIASYKIIVLALFLVSVHYFFSWFRSLKLSLFKLSWEKATTIAVAIVGIAITMWEAIQTEKSHGPM